MIGQKSIDQRSTHRHQHVQANIVSRTNILNGFPRRLLLHVHGIRVPRVFVAPLHVVIVHLLQHVHIDGWIVRKQVNVWKELFVCQKQTTIVFTGSPCIAVKCAFQVRLQWYNALPLL